LESDSATALNTNTINERDHKVNCEPEKLFIGLMDFFSILLPGALLTWLAGG
jgi:hypothetical protein